MNQLLTELAHTLEQHMDKHRGTGRTTAMILSCNPGDAVVVHDQSFKRYVEAQLQIAVRPNVLVYVSGPNELFKFINQLTKHHKKIHVDHHLQEMYIHKHLDRAIRMFVGEITTLR